MTFSRENNLQRAKHPFWCASLLWEIRSLNVRVPSFPNTICASLSSFLHDSTDRLLRPLLAKRGFTTVAIDHRGLGESDVGFTSHKPEDCGQDLLLLLDQPEIRGKPVVLIGNSFGGAAAVWAAAERPSQIKGIVLVDAFVRDHPMPFGVPTLLRSLLNRYRSGRPITSLCTPSSHHLSQI